MNCYALGKANVHLDLGYLEDSEFVGEGGRKILTGNRPFNLQAIRMRDSNREKLANESGTSDDMST